MSRNLLKRRPIDPLTELRLQRGAEHLCRLGPRATAELFAEIAFRTGNLRCVVNLLSEYQELSPEVLRAVGGDSPAADPAGAVRMMPFADKGRRAPGGSALLSLPPNDRNRSQSFSVIHSRAAPA
jgi:hypothetical protein